MARLARVGDLVRVPRVLYHKRVHPNSTYAGWTKWPRGKKGAAWIRHCLDMLAEALTVATSIEERRLLIYAARERLGASHIEIRRIRELSRINRWGMRVAFEVGAAMRSDIGPLVAHTSRLDTRENGRPRS
jgi:hypothetical protein